MNMATPGSFFSRHIKSNREVSIFTGYAAGEEQMVVLRTIQPAKFHMDKQSSSKWLVRLMLFMLNGEKNTLRHSSLYILLVLVGAGGLFFSQKKRRFVERETSKAEALVRAARRELKPFRCITRFTLYGRSGRTFQKDKSVLDKITGLFTEGTRRFCLYGLCTSHGCCSDKGLYG